MCYRLFTVGSLAPTGASPVDPYLITASSTTTQNSNTATDLDAVQSNIAHSDQFTLATVLEMSAIHAAVTKECRLNASKAASYGTEGARGSGQSAAESMKGWCDWITLSHVEVRLILETYCVISTLHWLCTCINDFVMIHDM